MSNIPLKTLTYEDLGEKQREVIDAVKSGHNVCVTGPAGRGKSVVVKYIMDNMVGTSVCGSTGVAAVNVAGSTIYSWAGIGLGDRPADELYQNLKFKKKVTERIRKTKRLIIDEISMLSADKLDKIDYIFKKVRGSSLPFGGIQVLLTGDFLQIPLVRKEEGFAFEADSWKSAKIKTIHLDKSFRQTDDEFSSALDKLRLGIVDSQVIGVINRGMDNFKNTLKPIGVVLHSKNVDVALENETQYRKLDGKENVYHCADIGDENMIKNLDKNCPADRIVKLKIGARVMCLANVLTESGIVNGALGTVEGFTPVRDPIVLFDNGVKFTIERNRWDINELDIAMTEKMGKNVYKMIACREQIPLKLAYASSIHKVQGITLSSAILDLEDCFEFSQVYVSLSRLKSEKGLYIKSFNPSKVKAHPLCLAFYGYDENGKKKA